MELLTETKISKIFKFKHKNTNYVAKEFKKITNFVKEYYVLKQLGTHDNIIQNYGFMSNKKNKLMYIIFEMAHCDLAKFVIDNFEEDIEDIHDNSLRHYISIKFGIEIIKSIKYIHDQGYAHLDIKLENILITKKNKLSLKICDFGFATNTIMCSKHFGAPAYVAPEILTDNDYVAKKADIYSFGIVLYKILHGYLPHINNETTLCELLLKIKTEKIYCSKLINPDIAQFIETLVDHDPNERFDAQFIIQKLFEFKKYYENKYENIIRKYKHFCLLSK